MSNQHQRFVAAYLESFNATLAYEQAGYRARGHSAEASASRLLRHPNVHAAIGAALVNRMAAVARAQAAGCTVRVRVPGTRLAWFVGPQGVMQTAQQS